MPHANRIERIRPASRPPRKELGRLPFSLGFALAYLAVGAIPPLRAEGPKNPGPTALRAYPVDVKLRGPDSVQQLVIDATRPGQEAYDLTDAVAFTTSDSEVATVDRNGT